MTDLGTESASELLESQPPRDFPPKWLQVMGWICLPGTLVLALDLIFEQTILTWRRGPQMVGFTLTHAHADAFILLLLFTLLAYLYLLILFCLAISFASRRVSVHIKWIQIAALSLSAGVHFVPYSAWRFAVIKIAGPGQYAGEHLTFSAALGEGFVVRALLAKGVAVDTPAQDGRTALNAACVTKNVKLARFLLSKGAELNHAPDCEWVEEIVPHPDRVHAPGTSIVVH